MLKALQKLREINTFYYYYYYYYYDYFYFYFILMLTRSSGYPSVDWIPVGTVHVESLFSVVDSVFDSRRMSTLPIHVEEQMFLKCNRSLWIHKLG
jgi:hypothetical protein